MRCCPAHCTQTSTRGARLGFSVRGVCNELARNKHGRRLVQLQARAQIVALQAKPISAEAFRPFGQVPSPALSCHLLLGWTQQRLIGSHSNVHIHFGLQLIGPTDDMKAFDSEDAQLNLSNGVPRFYIMRLPAKWGLRFTTITHHKAVTQCLGSLSPPNPWCAQLGPGMFRSPQVSHLLSGLYAIAHLEHGPRTHLA
jgi:hypothetical protein